MSLVGTIPRYSRLLGKTANSTVCGGSFTQREGGGRIVDNDPNEYGTAVSSENPGCDDTRASGR